MKFKVFITVKIYILVVWVMLYFGRCVSTFRRHMLSPSSGWTHRSINNNV